MWGECHRPLRSQRVRPALRLRQTGRLTSIRAAHHPGYDRVVFVFAGRLPTIGGSVADSGSGSYVPKPAQAGPQVAGADSDHQDIG